MPATRRGFLSKRGRDAGGRFLLMAALCLAPVACESTEPAATTTSAPIPTTTSSTTTSSSTTTTVPPTTTIAEFSPVSGSPPEILDSFEGELTMTMSIGSQDIVITSYSVYTDTGFRCDQVLEFAGLRQTQSVYGSPSSIWVNDTSGTTEYPSDSPAAGEVGSLCAGSPVFWDSFSGMEGAALESVDSSLEDLRGVPSRAVDLVEVLGSFPTLGVAGLEGLTFESAVLWIAEPGAWTSGIDMVMEVDPETAQLAFGIPAEEGAGSVVMDMRVRVFNPDDPTLRVPLPQPDGARAGYGDVSVTGSALPDLDGVSDQAIGSVAPIVLGSDWKGRNYQIGPDGRPKIVVFLAHWCPHCQADVPVIVEWLAGGGLPDDIDLIGVATSTDGTSSNWPPETWLQGAGWAAPLIMDDEGVTAADALGVTAFPFYVVLDGGNVNLGRFTGEMGEGGLDTLVAVAHGD